MADELSLTVSASFTRNSITLSKSFTGNTTVHGDYPISQVATIGVVDETLALGDVATPGYLVGRNLEDLVLLTSPPATPTITHAGASGAATWTYKVVAKDSNGNYTAASSGGTTTSGNANLTGSNYNIITWAEDSNAVGYDIYRTAVGTTPATTGKIASNVSSPYQDQGDTGDGSTAPTAGIDNTVTLGADGSSYPIKVKGQEFFAVRWNGSAVHAIAATVPCALEYLLIPD